VQGGRALPTDKAEVEEEEEEVEEESEVRRVEESAMAGPQEVVALEGRVEYARTLSYGRAFKAARVRRLREACMASTAPANPHRVPLVAHLALPPSTMAALPAAPPPPSPPLSTLCDSEARAAMIPSVPFCTMACASSPAKLEVPEAVGEGVTRGEGVKWRVAASALMVGVGGEDGRDVGVNTLDLVPRERVAVAERELVDAKDCVCVTDEDELAVGLIDDVTLWFPEGLVDPIVLVGSPVGKTVLDPEDEPARTLVGVTERLSDTDPLPVAPIKEGVDVEERDKRGDNEYEVVAVPVLEELGEADGREDGEREASKVELVD